MLDVAGGHESFAQSMGEFGAQALVKVGSSVLGAGISGTENFNGLMSDAINAGGFAGDVASTMAQGMTSIAASPLSAAAGAMDWSQVGTANFWNQDRFEQGVSAGLQSAGQQMLSGFAGNLAEGALAGDLIGFSAEHAAAVNSVASFGGSAAQAGFEYMAFGSTSINVLNTRDFAAAPNQAHGLFALSFDKDNGVGGAITSGGHSMSASNIAEAMAGWDAFATQTGIRWYDATRGPEIVEGYTGTESAAVALRANYSFGNDAAREQLGSILNGETTLLVGGMDDPWAIGETEMSDGQRTVHVSTLGDEGDVLSQLAASTVLQWEAHRDGHADGKLSELTESATANAQMVDRLVGEFGFGVAMSNTAVFANYVSYLNTAGSGDDQAYNRFVLENFSNERDAMRPFVDDRAGTAGIRLRGPDSLGLHSKRYFDGGTPVRGAIETLTESGSRALFGDREALLDPETGRPMVSSIPGDGKATIMAGADLAMTARGVRNAESGAGALFAALGFSLPTDVMDLTYTAMRAADGVDNTLVGRIYSSLDSLMNPEPTTSAEVPIAVQAARKIRGIDRRLEAILDGRIVTPRQMASYNSEAEWRSDFQVGSTMGRLGLPLSTPLRSEWTVAERAEAANQIARNYMAVAMLQNELDLPNDESIAYFMYGGAGPMASFENPDTGVEYDFATWYTGFVERNTGSIDYPGQLEAMETANRWRDELEAYNGYLEERFRGETAVDWQFEQYGVQAWIEMNDLWNEGLIYAPRF